MTAPSFEDRVSATLLRLRKHAPYFATLAMYARILPSEAVPVAATDGLAIHLNPERFAAYQPEYRQAILLHQVLHAALLHLPRRGPREEVLWNIAADIVTNGMVVASGIPVPRGALRDPDLEHLPVEEVYALLERAEEKRKLPRRLRDLCADLSEQGPGMDGAQVEHARTHWKRALDNARVAARLSGQGAEPAGFEREFDQVRDPALDWRSLLWRYLARTPSDFEGFDRRFTSRGLYLDVLEGQSLQVYLAVDTSGSIDRPQMTGFLSEVQAILRSYPHVQVALYYADAGLYGPHALSADSALPPPRGGGGTDFRPFFQEVCDRVSPLDAAIAVYLTDGYGTFPERPPPIPVIWAITAGGLRSGDVPFGQKMRLVGGGHRG